MKPKRKKMKIALFLLLGVVVVWMLGDFIYSRIVAARMKSWEATIERDEDGVRKGCREYTIGSGDTALLLVHGINDSPHAYYKMAPVLAEKGFTCRVMRLPGFAMPMEEYSNSKVEDWLAAIDGELKMLRESHDRVCIVAHSLGGASTISYLADHPDAVDRAVLIAPALGVSSQRSPLLSSRAWHEIGRRLLLFTRVTESPFPNDAHDPAEQEYPLRTPYSPRVMFDETFRLIDSLQSRGPDFTTPLMMVLSKDDQVVDWQAAERFYNEAASTEKTIRFMDDAGHAITVDRGWRELTDEIAEFVGAEK